MNVYSINDLKTGKVELENIILDTFINLHDDHIISLLMDNFLGCEKVTEINKKNNLIKFSLRDKEIVLLVDKSNYTLYKGSLNEYETSSCVFDGKNKETIIDYIFTKKKRGVLVNETIKKYNNKELTNLSNKVFGINSRKLKPDFNSTELYLKANIKDLIIPTLKKIEDEVNKNEITIKKIEINNENIESKISIIENDKDITKQSNIGQNVYNTYQKYLAVEDIFLIDKKIDDIVSLDNSYPNKSKRKIFKKTLKK